MERAKQCFGLLVALLLVLPLLAGLFGVRARVIENRALAPLPAKLRFGDLFDPSKVATLTRVAIDHLPLRDRAVAARAQIVIEFFGDSPSRSVRMGSDGWLYLDESFSRGCTRGSQIEVVTATMRRLGSMLEESGREFVLAIAPDKNAIYPEHLGAVQSLAECAQAQRARLREVLREEPPPGYIDLWQVLSEAKTSWPGVPLYSKTDTHWLPFGVAQATREIVERVAPGLWRPRDLVRTHSVASVGDLTKLLGLTSTTTVPQHLVLRPRVKTRRQRNAANDSLGTILYSSVAVRGRAELSSKRVLLLVDSFGILAAPMIAAYFEETAMTQWRFVKLEDARSDFIRRILRADVVIVETVEHHSYKVFDDSFPDEFLREIERALESDALREERREAQDAPSRTSLKP